MAPLLPSAAALLMRDPMQLFFFVAGTVGRSAMLFMRAAGVGFVCLGMVLIAAVGGVFAFAVIPIMADTPAQLAAHVLTTVWLLFNIYFNYALCIATDPGTVRSPSRQRVVSDSESDDGSESDNGNAVLLPRVRRSPPHAPAAPARGPRLRIYANPNAGSSASATYCRTCRVFRPARAHHCAVCDKCIDHMDHHCPWVNNCVGRDNYQFFVRFLLWLVVGCVYAAYMSFPAAYGELTAAQFSKLVNIFSTPLLRGARVAPAKYLQFAFCIAVSAGIAVSILGGWHLYLIATAQTSIEYQINRSSRSRRQNGGKVVSPYSAGSVHANWELVFGKCRLKILSLLPSTDRHHPSADDRPELQYDSAAAPTPADVMV
ncbi:hypothetical protein PybrP1_009713 [[Pythium] brassicae (nom. inval.)]|nr:hypothetical protein PybrP1_009713 [[Pythium] brassicae (nom. inval.)]